MGLAWALFFLLLGYLGGLFTFGSISLWTEKSNAVPLELQEWRLLRQTGKSFTMVWKQGDQMELTWSDGTKQIIQVKP